jgi:predicted O-methyltransferase YrrM
VAYEPIAQQSTERDKLNLLSTLIKRLPASMRKRLANHLLSNFSFWQSNGVHVLPVHFYQPIPNTETLSEIHWTTNSTLPGVRLNDQEQLALLGEFSNAYRNEYESLPRECTNVAHQFFINNGAFESVDAEILYCMVRHLKPRRIFEIGSGNTTYLSAQALWKNVEDGAPQCELIAFEPYPNEVLRAGFPGLTGLVEVKAQDIPLEKFSELRENDILFIDSSHVLKIGSDVQYLYLEVLPRLRPGVMVHVHDIFLPAEYPRKWIMEDHRFWNEQYLLQAFLAFNESFKIFWASGYMHLNHPTQLEDTLSSYDPLTRSPGSFWLRRVA